MKKIIAVLVAVTVFCSVSAPAFAAYKDEYKLDIVPSLTTAWGMGASYFTDLVRERSLQGSGFHHVMNKFADIINFAFAGTTMRFLG